MTEDGRGGQGEAVGRVAQEGRRASQFYFSRAERKLKELGGGWQA